MKMPYQHIKIKGGRVNLDKFRQIIKVLLLNQVDKFTIGENQTIYFKPANNNLQLTCSIEALNCSFQTKDNFNIVSSIPALDILSSTNWMHAGVYSKITQSFPNIKPLTVRIVDPSQRLVSLFGSKINFIVSDQLNFWHVYIRKHDGTYFLWPVLINSNSIGESYDIFCKILLDYPTIENKSFVKLFNEQSNTISTRNYIDKPKIETMEFPYFDGFHFTGKDYWLGFCGAKGYFKTSEIDAFLALLQNIKINEIYLNLRGGLILKGIDTKNINLLNQFIKQSSFKTGRAFNELGWQFDALDNKALDLKENFSNQLSKIKNSNHGFSVKLIANKQLNLTNEDTDFVISYTSFFSKITFLDKFRLWIKASNFPADGIYKPVGNSQSFSEVLDNLHAKLLVASKLKPEIDLQLITNNSQENSSEVNKPELYACMECDTIYDSILGDINQQIIPNTSFQSLPETYCCSVCGANKNSILFLEKF